MKRNAQLLALLVLIAAACDSPTSTRRQVAEIVVTPSDAHIPIGSTRQLTAATRDERGTPVNGVTITWTSSNAAAVSVSPTGLATAHGPGAAEITARAGTVSGSAMVSVAAALGPSCLGTAAVLRLGVGEVYTAAAGEGSVLCVDGGGPTGADYTLIPFYGSAVAEASTSLQIATQGTLPPLGAAAAATAQAASARQPVAPGTSRLAERDVGWELRLRQREIRELTPLIPVARAAMARSPEQLRPNLLAGPSLQTVGAQLQLNVNASSACSDPVWRTGEVIAVTDRAVVVADVSNPAGGFTQAEYEAIGRTFDEVVYPTITHNFGTPSDIDNNSRVLLFFTRAVNDMTVGSGSVVSGFFFSRDLFPRSGTTQQQACSASNQAEILYMMVPDPARAQQVPNFSKDNVQRTTPSVLAHEFQHLINAAQRLFTVQTGNFEETWLNEGLSHIAEELVGNQLSGFGRRENIDYARISATPTLMEHFQTYHRENFNRLARHLGTPQATALYDATAPLAGRGAAWQFLRYAADRRPGDEAPLWRSMITTSSTGLTNIRNAFGTDPLEWMRDWAVAVYTDDEIAGADARFTQPGWNYRSVFTGLQAYRRYPLATQDLPINGSMPLTVTAGGAAYLRFGVAPGGEAEIRTSSGGLTPPHRLLLSIVRTR